MDCLSGQAGAELPAPELEIALRESYSDYVSTGWRGGRTDREAQDPKITRVRICNVLTVGRLAQVTGSEEVSGNQDI